MSQECYNPLCMFNSVILDNFMNSRRDQVNCKPQILGSFMEIPQLRTWYPCCPCTKLEGPPLEAPGPAKPFYKAESGLFYALSSVIRRVQQTYGQVLSSTKQLLRAVFRSWFVP